MVISTPDLREAEHRGMPVAQAFLRHGARSCVTVALRKEESLLGLITIYREEVRPFDPICDGASLSHRHQQQLQGFDKLGG